jgi:hypothetical protein
MMGSWYSSKALVTVKIFEAEFAPFNGVHNHTVCQLLGVKLSSNAEYRK